MRIYQILHVDDMTFYKSLLKDHLNLWSHPTELHFCNSAEKAVTVLKERPIDMVICDYNMPKHNGLMLLETMKKSPNYKNIPFIMLSSEDEKQLILKSLEKGAQHYLVKPWEASQLHVVLDKYLIFTEKNN